MKYLIQDGEKIKKATMEGLEEVKEEMPDVSDFEIHGTDDLSDIIGNFNKEVDMIYKRDLNDKKMYGYKLTGFKDINALAIK